MSLISKHKPVFNRLFRLKNLKIRLMERREISFAQRPFAEDKGKEKAVNDDTSKQSDEIVTDNRENTEALAKTDTSEKTRKSSFMERMKESHEQTVRDATGVYIRPTTADKVALLWSGKYPRREDIPEFVHRFEQIAADNYARVIIFIWMMVTVTLYFITMIKCGQRRTRLFHERITEEQNRIWREREAEEERRMLEKRKPKHNV